MGSLEHCVNEADKRNLTDPAGIGVLRKTLDRRTFVLTDSELERRFLRLVRGAGVSLPRTGRTVNGFKVDFYWPEVGLVVETDGLRYHRTPAQQARDRVRDQVHAAAGLTPLRFTRAQVPAQRCSKPPPLRRSMSLLSPMKKRKMTSMKPITLACSITR